MEDRYVIASVQKALRILRIFIEHDECFTFSDIAEASGGMNKSNVLRILSTLKAEGYIFFDDSANLYSRGPVFASIVKDNEFEELRRILLPDLKEAAAKSGMIVHFTVLDGLTLRILLRCFPSPSFESLALADIEGSDVPLNATGAGKVYAAFSPDEIRRNLIDSCQFASYSPNTITDRKQFENVVEKVRRDGFATNNCEHEEFLCCLTRPVFSSNGSLIGALSFSGLKEMFKGERAVKVDALSRKLSSELSRRFGYENIR